jgi:hypothetical protein
VSTDDDVIGTPEERDAIEAALNAGRDGEAERLLIEMLDRDDEMRDRPTRRAEACAAFFDLVTEFGSAKIDCDMESYGRQPGDIVVILVAAPMGGYYSSHEIVFSAEVIRAFSALLRPIYEADAALLTGKAPASSGGSPQRGEGGEG